MRQVGTLIIYESPDSPQWKFAEHDTCVRTFTGPYADLFAMRPPRGEPMEGTGDNMLVQDSTLKRSKLGQGTLTVNLAGSNPATGSSDPDDPLSTLIEIDWVAVQKDLRTHPAFTADGSYPIDTIGWARIEKWKNEQDETLKSAMKYRPADGSAAVDLTDDQKIVAGMILKGVDGYNLYAPVVRKTTVFPLQPGSGTAGFIQQMNQVIAYDIPAGYEWLKTACRLVQQQDRTWQRTEEWTGAEKWDPILYPNSPPGVAGKKKKANSKSPITHQP